MKNKLTILMLLWQSASFATVNIAKEIKVPEKKQIINTRLKGSAFVKTLRNKKQIQIEGYADSSYIRLIVDIDNDKVITGQMFRENEPATYIYGEFLDDALHIYEPTGKHITIILD